LVDKHILKDFCQYQGRLTCVLLSPLFSLTYLYHRSSSLHKLLYIIYAQSTFCLFFCPHQCNGIHVVKIHHLFSLMNHQYDLQDI
jgi:hypothetical protein